MSASLKIEQPGLLTTVQDRGRPGYQDAGVPPSGALDVDSLVIANALVGNDPGLATLEIRYTGPTFVIDADHVLLALTGTGGGLRIEHNGRSITAPAYRSVIAGRGAKVSVPSITDSATAYIAIGGGIDVAPVLGSRSTYARSGFGGYRGRPLQAGDVIAVGATGDAPRQLSLAEPFDLASRERIRAVPGPQADRFTDEALALFESAEWRVSALADRMGMRLEGPALAHSAGHDIVSDGIVTGSIQVPGNGLPIVLLADHQTTGGYPKIATVISADIGALGRARGGDTVQFELVSVADAFTARAEHRKQLSDALAAIAPAEGFNLDLAKLYSENLISGIHGEC